MNQNDRQGKTPWKMMTSVLIALALFAAACGGSDGEAVVDTAAVDQANAAAEAAQAEAAELQAELEAAQAAAADAGGDDEALAAAEEALAEAQAAASEADERAAAAEAAADEAAMAAEGEAPTRSITVALVGNDNIVRMGELASEFFTPATGIEVNLTVLDEQTLREVTTRDVGATGEQFDVVQIGMYETPQFGANGWLVPLNGFAATSTTYDIDDLIPAVRNGLSVNDQLFSSPFYAESSFVMYRSDIIDNMPDAPTWDEVAAIAREIDSDEMAGICLRGKPGWGDLGAAFTTVLNTFGGTWWAARVFRRRDPCWNDSARKNWRGVAEGVF